LEVVTIKGTVTQIIGDSVTIAIGKATSGGAVRAAVGDTVYLSTTDLDRQMKVAERVMQDDYDLLRELAK
jgi:hypothetical protein